MEEEVSWAAANGQAFLVTILLHPWFCFKLLGCQETLFTPLILRIFLYKILFYNSLKLCYGSINAIAALFHFLILFLVLWFFRLQAWNYQFFDGVRQLWMFDLAGLTSVFTIVIGRVFSAFVIWAGSSVSIKQMTCAFERPSVTFDSVLAFLAHVGDEGFELAG